MDKPQVKNDPEREKLIKEIADAVEWRVMRLAFWAFIGILISIAISKMF